MSKQLDIDFAAAAARRDLGIERAARGAGDPWTEHAASLIDAYAQQHLPFLIEDVAAWAYENHYASPPADGRAWGAAARLAVRRGHIRQCGYRKAKTSNLSPKVLWERTL